MIAALCLMGMGAMAQGKKAKEAPVPMYEVKSGIVTMEMEMMGQKIVQEIYFDDYGLKQAMKLEFQGRKVRAVEVDGENVMIDDESKTATKMPAMGMGTNEKINFLDKSEKNIKKNKIKELGEEEIAGKLCKKYSYRTAGMNGPVTQYVWIYKGITLKSAMDMGFGEMGQTALSLEEDIEVDPALFTLPEGVKVEKMQMPQMGGFGGPGGPGGFGGGGFGGGMDDGFGGF